MSPETWLVSLSHQGLLLCDAETGYHSVSTGLDVARCGARQSTADFRNVKSEVGALAVNLSIRSTTSSGPILRYSEVCWTPGADVGRNHHSTWICFFLIKQCVLSVCVYLCSQMMWGWQTTSAHPQNFVKSPPSAPWSHRTSRGRRQRSGLKSDVLDIIRWCHHLLIGSSSLFWKQIYSVDHRLIGSSSFSWKNNMYAYVCNRQ